MNDVLVDEAIGFIRGLFANRSDGHDVEHSLRVYRNARKIASCESDYDEEVVVLAALLHDVDDSKLFETKDNANARGFLNSVGISAEKIDKICAVINSVSFSHNRGRTPESMEGKIVQDADRLDAMGAIGIARTYAYGGSHGRSLEMSKQHFYDKLLLLKDEMNTEKGRELAQRRHAFLEAFLNELDNE